jgi:hypothetical protein
VKIDASFSKCRAQHTIDRSYVLKRFGSTDASQQKTKIVPFTSNGATVVHPVNGKASLARVPFLPPFIKDKMLRELLVELLPTILVSCIVFEEGHQGCHISFENP